MYAVIETGGKQYRVEVGTELAVELLDVEPGEEITLDRVLLVADGDDSAIGRPVVDGAAVRATVLRADRGEKVISFKYKPKTRRRVKKGHRQEQTILRITDVRLGARSAAADMAAAEEAKANARMRAEEEAAARAAADAALAATLAERARAAEEEAAAEPAKAPKRPRARAKSPAPAPEPTADVVDESLADAAGAGDALEAAAAPAPEAPAPEDAGSDAAQTAAPAKPKRTRGPKKED